MTARVAPRRSSRALPLIPLIVGLGCGPKVDPDLGVSSAATDGDGDTDASLPLHDDPPVVADEPPPPISGGTLHRTADGRFLVVADPARDLVHVVEAATATLTHTIELDPGDRPTRIAEDVSGVVHVVARGTDTVIAIEVESGRVVERRSTCSGSRGVAFDPFDDRLWFTCSGGRLLAMPLTGDGPHREFVILDGGDLRDVLVEPDFVRVTRFREAEVVTVTRGGEIIDVDGPIATSGRPLSSLELDRRPPMVAWRTRATADGQWLMVHQRASTAPIESASESPEDGYGQDPGSCDGPTSPAVTLRRRDGTQLSTQGLQRSVLVVDGAASANEMTIAMVAAGTRDRENLLVARSADLTDALAPDCLSLQTFDVPGQLTSVEFDGDDAVWVLGREPARLTRVDLDSGQQTEVALPGASIADAGHDLFHLDSGASAACASCHPEGEDDGHVHRFADRGFRRTQSLAVGLEDTAPYQWDGEFASLSELTADVHVIRMNAAQRDEAYDEALVDWLFALRVPAPARTSDDPQVATGRAVFERVGCDRCHRGASLTNNLNTSPTGLDALQVPTLRGVGSHPPFMHDGRSETLTEAVIDMLAWSDTSAIGDGEIEALVAYLESL